MKFSEIRNALDPRGWLIVGGLFLVMVIAAWWLVTEPGRERQRAAQARAAGTVAEAGERASGAAVEAVAAQAERQASRDETTRNNRDDILSAPGAAAPVDPGVNNAGLRAQCVRDPSRDPRCAQLLKSGSAAAPGRR